VWCHGAHAHSGTNLLTWLRIITDNNRLTACTEVLGRLTERSVRSSQCSGAQAKKATSSATLYRHFANWKGCQKKWNMHNSRQWRLKTCVKTKLKIRSDHRCVYKWMLYGVPRRVHSQVYPRITVTWKVSRTFQSPIRKYIIEKELHTDILYIGAGVAQSVWCLTTDWTAGQSVFDPRQR
jgi:hypothetical protein